MQIQVVVLDMVRLGLLVKTIAGLVAPMAMTRLMLIVLSVEIRRVPQANYNLNISCLNKELGQPGSFIFLI
jgi:hypothetical protein